MVRQSRSHWPLYRCVQSCCHLPFTSGHGEGSPCMMLFVCMWLHVFVLMVCRPWLNEAIV
jgi:hypothetical protein